MENILRYNVFDRNVGGMIVFRNGDRNIAYSNIFIRGSGGIRVKEANEILAFNNYFDGANNPRKYPAIVFDYVNHDKINNVTFAFNTLVNSAVDMGDLINPSQNSLKLSKNIELINNVFYQTKTKNSIFYDYTLNLKYGLSEVISFDGNVFDATDSFLQSDSSMFLKKRNKLQSGVLKQQINGFYALSSNLIATYNITNDQMKSSGFGDYFGLIMDIDGRTSSSQRNVGCQQYSNSMDGSFAYLNLQRGPSYLVNPVV